MSDIEMFMGAVGDLRKDMVGGFRDIGNKVDAIVRVEADHDKRIDEAKRVADEAKVEVGTLNKYGKGTRKYIIYGVIVIFVSILTLVGVAAGFPGIRGYLAKLITGG